MSVYFEENTQDYYKENILIKEDEVWESMDMIGPFTSENRLYENNLIHHCNTLSYDKRKEYLENIHCQEGYETVWSITDDKQVRERIILELSSHHNLEKILIPGCGSRVSLQNEIARCFINSNILCTDFDGVVESAISQSNENNIDYKALDSSNLGFYNEWDAIVIVIVNSVLSESHEENIMILNSCYKALKPGSVLIGFFPTIFASLDIAYLESSQERIKYIDINKSSLFEENKKIWKIFYTPLRLRKDLINSGFKTDKMELYFCDSEYFKNHSSDYYGIQDPNLTIYEHLVVAHKSNG